MMKTSIIICLSWLPAYGIAHAFVGNKYNKNNQVRYTARVSEASYKDSFEFTNHISVTGNLRAGLSQATKQDKKILVAFVGDTDVNSKKDLDALSQPIFKNALNQYIVVVLFADNVPSDFFDKESSVKQRRAEGEANYLFESLAFGTSQIPFYATITPIRASEFEIVSDYGKKVSDDPDAFLQFLRGPKIKSEKLLKH